MNKTTPGVRKTRIDRVQRTETREYEENKKDKFNNIAKAIKMIQSFPDFNYKFCLCSPSHRHTQSHSQIPSHKLGNAIIL